MVGTNPQDLVSSHQDSIEPFVGVEEDFDVADASLLPHALVSVPPVKLGSFLKQDLLIFLSGLGLHLKAREHKNTIIRVLFVDSLGKSFLFWLI